MNRQINYLRHAITSRQALSILIRNWSMNRSLPVAVVVQKGKASDTIQQIRVALSKERRAQQGPRVDYGFVASDAFPYTDDGVKGEAVMVRLRVTRLQSIRNSVRRNLAPLTT